MPDFVFLQLIRVFWRDTLAAVFDFYPNVFSILAGTDSDPAKILDRMRGIHQQVHEYLIELRRETLDLRDGTIFLDDFGLVFEFVSYHSERALQSHFQICPLPL